MLLSASRTLSCSAASKKHATPFRKTSVAWFETYFCCRSICKISHGKNTGWKYIPRELGAEKNSRPPMTIHERPRCTGMRQFPQALDLWFLWPLKARPSPSKMSLILLSYLPPPPPPPCPVATSNCMAMAWQCWIQQRIVRTLALSGTTRLCSEWIKCDFF
jgi:hypothetical protein